MANLSPCAREWRAVNDFHEYEVSNDGLVRRVSAAPGAVPGKILKPTYNPAGYATIGLWRQYKQTRRMVHRLVALAFLGDPPPGKDFVAHWDGNPANNAVANLRWASRSENEADKIRHGRHQIGERNRNAKLDMPTVSEIRSRFNRGERQADLRREYGISSAQISRICNLTRWPEVIDGRAYFRGEVVA